MLWLPPNENPDNQKVRKCLDQRNNTLLMNAA